MRPASARSLSLRYPCRESPNWGNILTAKGMNDGERGRHCRRLYRARETAHGQVDLEFGGVMSTVMVPTDYSVPASDTIYLFERFF